MLRIGAGNGCYIYKRIVGTERASVAEVAQRPYAVPNPPRTTSVGVARNANPTRGAKLVFWAVPNVSPETQFNVMLLLASRASSYVSHWNEPEHGRSLSSPFFPTWEATGACCLCKDWK